MWHFVGNHTEIIKHVLNNAVHILIAILLASYT